MVEGVGGGVSSHSIVALAMRWLFGLQLVGLTGGIACGKSTATRILRSLGANVIDFDQLSREVVEVGEPGWQAVRREFGRSVFRDNDTLDRAALGELVFGNRDRLKTLNRIMQKHILSAFIKHLMIAFFWRFSRVCVLDVPLLFETNMHWLCSDVLVISCPEDVMLQRMFARDGLDAASAQRRIDAQMPVSRKRMLATQVIENNSSETNVNSSNSHIS